MKAKLNKVFFVTYNDDNTKSPLMIFDQSLITKDIEKLVFKHLNNDDCLRECYDDADLKNAANIIANGDSWNSGTEEYYIEAVTEYYL